jgi:uncharacterized membrane protein
MNAERLGRQLRHSAGGYLRQRRGVAALSLGSIASLGLISLYQIGLIPHVPEPPLPHFDADKVNGSAEAYAKLATPDAILGLASYAATMTLAMMGSEDRAQEQPWLPLAFATKVGFDAALALQLFAAELTKHKALCFWCLLVTAATLGSVPLVVPEAKAALRALRGT